MLILWVDVYVGDTVGKELNDWILIQRERENLKRREIFLGTAGVLFEAAVKRTSPFHEPPTKKGNHISGKSWKVHLLIAWEHAKSRLLQMFLMCLASMSFSLSEFIGGS